MDNDSKSAMFSGIADALNRKLPVTNEDTFRGNLERTFAGVRDNHKSYAWPPQAEFVSNLSTNGSSGKKAQETFSLDPDELAAKRMNNRDSVSERYVWGRASVRIYDKQLIDRETLELYRRGDVERCKEVYRDDAKRIMEQRHGHVVLQYFPSNEKGAA